MTKRQFIKYINTICELPIEDYQDKYILNAYPIYVSFFECSEETGIYERIYAMRKVKNRSFEYQEVMIVSERFGTFYKNCFFSYSGLTYGLHTYGWDKKDYKYRYYETLKYMSKFEESAIDQSDVRRHENIDIEKIAAYDPALRYCSFVSNGFINAFDYFKIYRKYPICEMLMKLNIFRMFNERALKTISSDKHLQKWLFANANTVRSMHFNTAFNAYKKNCDPEKYSKDISMKMHFAYMARGYKNTPAYIEITKCYDFVKVMEYAEKAGVASYFDYIDACIFLHLDLSIGKVAFPHNFKKMHDDYTSQHNAEKNKIINTQMRKIAKKYLFLEYSDGKYKTAVAKNKNELIREGDKLHHCVGRMNYDEKQAKEQSVICFVRTIKNPDTPYITVEVECKTLKVLQCYGSYDGVVNNKVSEFVNKWIKTVKSRKTRKAA